MKANIAKTLLQKFFEAETSLEEEKMLREYFSLDEVDPELLPYREFFVDTENHFESKGEKEIEEKVMDYILENESKNRGRYRQLWLTVSGIAASLVIAVSAMLYYQNQQPYQDTFTNPDEAYAYAEQTLAFVSQKYNQGLASLEPLKKVNQSVRPLENGFQTLNKGFNQLPENFLKGDDSLQ
jgi:hypothetical protein